MDIGEVAERAGIAPSTLRFYEKKGLICPLGRHGLRRQYREDVLNQLQLIALGQAAGFTLDEMAQMFDPRGKVTLDPKKIVSRAQEIDHTIRKLRLLSRGLKHIAGCSAPEHSQCPEFQKIVARGLFLTR
nr:helix-turn-helix domain-containing protein [Kosakonia sp.]